GAVKDAQVVQDRETGRSKGFGFVEMEDENAAQEAIRGLNEKEYEGRNLTVNEARPREERSGGGGGRGYGGGRGGRRGGGWWFRAGRTAFASTEPPRGGGAHLFEMDRRALEGGGPRLWVCVPPAGGGGLTFPPAPRH